MATSGLQFVTGSGLEKHLGGNIAEGDPRTFAPSVWDYLIKRFAINSVLDLGSGLGFAAHYFHCSGLKTVAVEGLPFNVRHSLYPSLQADITKSPVVCRVDLVHCQEVVEHISEEYIENLLTSLTCGRILVMTHAFPGQGGYHHVNEQNSDYWIRQLMRYSFELLEEDTQRIRQLAVADGACYLATSGLLFVNRNWF